MNDNKLVREAINAPKNILKAKVSRARTGTDLQKKSLKMIAVRLVNSRLLLRSTLVSQRLVPL